MVENIATFHPNKDKAVCNLQLALVDHWTIFGYKYQIKGTTDQLQNSEESDMIVPSWAVWPFMLKQMKSEKDYSHQRLIYTQLLSDSTSVYNPLYN
ncbi:hypothetical protein AYI69_g3519 [Smittium culicis]|uniref:Uncharacterized protein n=1 Tax=Smittium culicis TaxID=133412 RepID=A0A1R1YJJ0_9FUNG|nr:hypothetical protein AYI69_g3519 [Smittium culicis]